MIQVQQLAKYRDVNTTQWVHDRKSLVKQVLAFIFLSHHITHF